MTDHTATDQLMQRHAELQASAARAATADASASTTSVTSGAAVDLHVRPPRYRLRGSAMGPPAFGSGMTSPPCC
jgi:hypothetical protein